MGLSFRNIKKWTKMVFGRSISHVKQDIGLFYSKESVRGYYNDLRGKVTHDHVAPGELPKDPLTEGEVHVPTIIVQYGLGCYDCFLESGDETYLKSFSAAIVWTADHMNAEGGIPWEEEAAKVTPYSAMTQGEAVSLFLRAYAEYKDEQYLEYARRAYDFMLKKTVLERDGMVLYEEFIGKPIVLNGMIFAVFGIYDYWLVSKDELAKERWDEAVKTLVKIVPGFDSGKWIYYTEDKKYTSKFYANLHAALLRALYDLTGEELFNEYAVRWNAYLHKPFRRFHYFWKKAWQKIKE